MFPSLIKTNKQWALRLLHVAFINYTVIAFLIYKLRLLEAHPFLCNHFSFTETYIEKQSAIGVILTYKKSRKICFVTNNCGALV